MTLGTLRACFECVIKVVSTYNGRVLMHSLDSKKHDAFMGIEVYDARPALSVTNGSGTQAAVAIIECSIRQSDYDYIKLHISGGK